MYTQFSTAGAQFLMRAPMIRIPPQADGAGLLSAIGGAYESEESHLRSRLLREAYALRSTIEALPESTKTAAFLEALSGLITYLESETENTVTLFSSDRRPGD